ncbi:hypothetical protein [Kingella kingae]|uniref:hypothetical protein n=1 Tax=Kingella kingae TaxID=504 RepID=UPI00040660BA
MDSSLYRKPPIIIAQLLSQYRYWRRKLLRLLDIKGRSAWIYSPDCQAHFAGSLHPESPERTNAIARALKNSGLWILLQKIEAPEVSDIQLARVHTRRYLSSLESQVPQTGSVKINEDTFLSRDSLQAARKAAGAAVKAVAVGHDQASQKCVLCRAPTRTSCSCRQGFGLLFYQQYCRCRHARDCRIPLGARCHFGF